MKIIATSVWEISHIDLGLRLFVSLMLGGMIGLEREWSNHSAGFRTHILVCLGSTAIMLLSIYGFGEFADEYNVRMDPARLAAQVISGIGFLGAGAILRNGSSVAGLTTAASIWAVAAIGLCVGAGFFEVAGTVTVLVWISLFLLNKLERRFRRRRRKGELSVTFRDSPGAVADIFGQVEKLGLHIDHMRADSAVTEENGLERTLHLRIRITAEISGAAIMNAFLSLGGVLKISLPDAADLNHHAGKPVDG
ncbi:MgtC/SapB family protein [Paenibacillaceae bacterium WGS1546]|uniref:MgtC/SapB family protein n=1 Tax=Cohnella sp. WGS1546 TaxID=3366810 RepID=UPI00372D3D56